MVIKTFLTYLFHKNFWKAYSEKYCEIEKKGFTQMQNGKMIQYNRMKIKWTMEHLFSKMYSFNNMWASTKMSSTFQTKQLCLALSEKKAVLP